MDLMFRATTKSAWDAYAAEMGLTYDTAYIDEIGPIVVTPAVISQDGTILTPAVMDDRHHVNVRVTHLPTVTDEDGNVTALSMADLAAGNADVEWVDPATVDNPRRIWAGGMRYLASEESIK
jgi:hypothetical protein